MMIAGVIIAQKRHARRWKNGMEPVNRKDGTGTLPVGAEGRKEGWKRSMWQDDIFLAIHNVKLAIDNSLLIVDRYVPF
jgi:hypothetical protein